MAALKELLTDSFDRANSGTLGANWTAIPSPFNTMQIVSNEAKGTVAAANNGSYWSGAGWTNQVDCWAEGILGTVLGSGQGSWSLMLRQSTVVVTMWYMQVAPGAGPTDGHYSIIKRIANVSTNLSDKSPFTYGAGDVVRATAIGDVLTLYRNGDMVNQIRDASIDGVTVGGTKVGLGVEDTVGAWASWRAGVFESGWAFEDLPRLRIRAGAMSVTGP